MGMLRLASGQCVCASASRSVLLLTLTLVLAAPFAGASQLSRYDAVTMTTDLLLEGSMEGVRIFVYPQSLPAGTVVSTWKREVFTTPAEGWFVFVDRMPAANWEHPCWYVFVDGQSGEVAKHDAHVPPELQPYLEEITSGRDNPPPEVSARMHAWFDQRMREVAKPARPDRGRAFAFIISGGANQGSNHIRYWNDSSFIYKALVNYYGYADENIYVCISDGLDPAVDRSDGTNSPPDLDGDGDDDIQYPATNEYIQLVFDELNTILTPGDQLFIFTTDHGGQESGWDCYLNLWNWEELPDQVLAAYVDALPCQTVICCFEQCFSGGMIDDLEGEGRVIATAARWDEYSWAMGPDYIYDTFVYFWTCAVGWEDPYGNPVDADTNDDGLISMHEAFLYAEANDHESETPQYSSTPPDLGDALNLYGNLEGVYLILEALVVDDDDEGASSGDGDGIIEFGETIELVPTLHNMGLQDGLDVDVTLSSTCTYVGLSVAEVNFGDIPSGGSVAAPEPFVFHVMYVIPDDTDLGFGLALSEEPGVIGLDLRAFAPTYLVGITEVDDSGGDGDGIPDPGETVVLTLAIDNVGSCDSPDVSALLSSGSEHFTCDETPHPLGVIPVGGGVVEAGFSVTIAADCPDIYTGYVHLRLQGDDFYEVGLPLALSVGQIFADDIEVGGASWTHYAGPGSWTDEWHLETYRNHTPGGAQSWKCGGAGAADYGNLLYAILETAPFDLPAGAQLSFWHWMDAEVSQAHEGYCYDGGLLEISTDGGITWFGLTPAGGYPYLVRTGGTPGPFPAETPVWSGQHDWTEVTVDLAAYEGLVKLRWAFGSDGAVAAEGWYVDDVRVLGAPPSGIETFTGEGQIRPLLLPARPNPWTAAGAHGANGSAVVLRFVLPYEADAHLDLFDASGRLVRCLATGAHAPGLHEISWDGTDAGGMPVGSGSYYYRL